MQKREDYIDFYKIQAIERKYKDKNDTEVTRAKQIADVQLLEQNNGELDTQMAICFPYMDSTVINPFMDITGRFELTLDEAYSYYGSCAMDWFITQCNLQTRSS